MESTHLGSYAQQGLKRSTLHGGHSTGMANHCWNDGGLTAVHANGLLRLWTVHTFFSAPCKYDHIMITYACARKPELQSRTIGLFTCQGQVHASGLLDFRVKFCVKKLQKEEKLHCMLKEMEMKYQMSKRRLGKRQWIPMQREQRPLAYTTLCAPVILRKGDTKVKEQKDSVSIFSFSSLAEPHQW